MANSKKRRLAKLFAPGLRRGLLLNGPASLPADLDAGAAGARAGDEGAFAGGDDLHPKRILVLVVGGGGGLAQGVQAVLRRTRGRLGEARQLEHHPRALVEFAEPQAHGRPLGGHLDLGARADVGVPGQGELLAIAADHDWRLGRTLGPAKPAGTATTSDQARTGRAIAGSSGRGGSRGGRGTGGRASGGAWGGAEIGGEAGDARAAGARGGDCQ